MGIFQNPQVDNSLEAYLQGFIYADGCITSKKSRIDGFVQYYALQIGLNEKDKDFLQKITDIFNNALNKEYLIKHNSTTKSYKLGIYNVELIDNLQKLGVNPNKTYEDSDFIFTNIPNNLKKSFLLGYWDGDGSFCYTKNSNRIRTIASIISLNSTLLSTIISFINSELGAGFCKLKDKTPGDQYYRIRVSDNKAKVFAKWLYNSIPDLYLIRKYEIANSFPEIREKCHFGWDHPRVKGLYCITSDSYYITARECALAEFNSNSITKINAINAVARGVRLSCYNKQFRFMTEEEREGYKNGDFTL